LSNAPDQRGPAEATISPAPGAADGRNRVAIFGAGPGGLSAALELAERGFDVKVYEKGSFLGGKSRSETVANSGVDGRKDLPIENGPHAYWGTYQHWNDTLARVQTEDGIGSVLDNLAYAGADVQRDVDGDRRKMLRRHRLEFAREILSRLLTWELPRLACKIAALATSGLMRQHDQLEDITLTQYTGPLSRKSFELLAALVSQVKVDPGLVSARETARNLHIFTGHFGAKGLGRGAHSLVGITQGPADEAIFAPFGRHLQKLGVRINMQNELLTLTSANGLVTGAQVRDASGVSRRVDADWYILAVPQDITPKVLTPELIAADPSLGELDRLGEQWLGAANVFLRGPSLPDAFCFGPWQLVAVDYSAAVPNFSQQYGDGTARQWMSIDLQTWDCPGLLYGKTAKECNKQEFFEEILAHLARVHPSSWGKLNRNNIIRWDVSRLLRYDPGQPAINDEPLFGAVAGAWRGQPRAVTAIDNLFIGATYARTTGGIDSMDCACEAARRSVNAILERTQTQSQRAFVDSYDTTGLLKWLWDYDDRRYRKGLPNRFDVIRPYGSRASQHSDESWRELL
jgi:hypothetical protein